MLLLPCRINRLRAVVSIRAVEQDDAVLELAVGEHPQQVALRFARLGEDDRLLGCTQYAGLGEGDGECLDEGLALGVVADGTGEMGEAVEIGDLRFDSGAVGIG